MLDEKKVDGEKKPADKKQLILSIIGIALCVILLPILIINCILIIQGIVNDKEVPNIGGNTPLIVLTESMADEIMPGDLIVCVRVLPEDVREGDVISFFDPAGSGTAVVTHRVVEKVKYGDSYYFRTKGDNNNTEDKYSVPAENLVGRWEGFRLPGVGHIALFMQSPWGLAIFIGLPLGGFIVYEVLRRRRQRGDVDALMAELEALRAAQAGGNTDTEPPAEKADEDSQNQ